MLAMDTGRVGLLPAYPPLVPRAEGAPAHTGITPPALPVSGVTIQEGGQSGSNPERTLPNPKDLLLMGTRHQTNVTPSVSLGSKVKPGEGEHLEREDTGAGGGGYRCSVGSEVAAAAEVSVAGLDTRETLQGSGGALRAQEGSLLTREGPCLPGGHGDSGRTSGEME